MAIDGSESRGKVPRYVGQGRGGTLTAPEARALLAEYDRSGQSLRAFAEARGLTGSQLYWWRNKFAQDPAPAASAALGKPPFVPVRLQDVRGQGPTVLAPGPAAVSVVTLLRIPSDFSEEALRRLLRVLRDAP